jgi:hypothetical protein
MLCVLSFGYSFDTSVFYLQRDPRRTRSAALTAAQWLPGRSRSSRSFGLALLRPLASLVQLVLIVPALLVLPVVPVPALLVVGGCELVLLLLVVLVLVLSIALRGCFEASLQQVLSRRSSQAPNVGSLPCLPPVPLALLQVVG